jgi:3-hydroxybutyryl-CoA dehydrogenase
VRVAVIGAGLMGAQIGCEYALGGHDVVLFARRPEQVRARVDETLALVEREHLAEPEAVAHAREAIVVADELTDALPCDLVVESVPEDLALKAELLGVVARSCPDAVLASNTSALSITELGDRIGAPERTIGTHYWNPPVLMPLVEVVAGERTDPAVVEHVRASLAALGKRPVVAGDVPGFIWNRLQFALLREMVWLVENEVASTDEVDDVLRLGLARRYRHVGLFQAIALGGPATWQQIGGQLLPHLSAATQLPPLGPLLPPAGTLAEVKQRRDAALAADLRRERGPASR